MLGINLMSSVISKLQTNPRQLTGVHSVLLQLCLSAHCLKPALPFLVDDVDDFTNDVSWFWYFWLCICSIVRPKGKGMRWICFVWF
jgi:hypothetical protein